MPRSKSGSTLNVTEFVFTRAERQRVLDWKSGKTVRVVVKIPLETSYKGIDPEQYQSFGQCSGGQTVVTH